jgi:hypothetical protein
MKKNMRFSMTSITVILNSSFEIMKLFSAVGLFIFVEGLINEKVGTVLAGVIIIIVAVLYLVFSKKYQLRIESRIKEIKIKFLGINNYSLEAIPINPPNYKIETKSKEWDKNKQEKFRVKTPQFNFGEIDAYLHAVVSIMPFEVKTKIITNAHIETSVKDLDETIYYLLLADVNTQLQMYCDDYFWIEGNEVKHGWGTCNRSWLIRKRYLASFGIEWKTPSELHPHIRFD